MVIVITENYLPGFSLSSVPHTINHAKFHW